MFLCSSSGNFAIKCFMDLGLGMDLDLGLRTWACKLQNSLDLLLKNQYKYKVDNSDIILSYTVKLIVTML